MRKKNQNNTKNKTELSHDSSFLLPGILQKKKMRPVF